MVRLEYQPTEVLYKKTNVPESQLASVREAAVNCGMALSYWGTKANKQCWISPDRLPINPPNIEDIYAVVGSNYVKIINHYPKDKNKSRTAKETRLIEAFKKILGE